MLPLVHKILFFIFALIAGGFGAWGFYRLSLRIKRGTSASELRFNNLIQRIQYAISISLTQERTFKNRPTISALHSFIFYGFMFYLLVNVIDGLEGYFHFSILSTNPLGAAYNFLADTLSILVLIGVIGLVLRRLIHPSRRDFRFTDKTLLHPLVKNKYILRDSLIVSAFILFHVGSRILGNSAKMVHEANDNQKVYDLFQPFSSLIGYLNFDNLSEAALLDWRIFGFWGALASILAFLAYFPFSKHIHLFMAPLNYALKRPVQSGVLPPMKGLEEAMEADEPKLGVEKLEDLEWPRLLDAYACIQCNRCQDVCPANVTGKALSPAALEINKRMELNVIGAHPSPFTLRRASFEKGGESEKSLLEFAINPESIWACTTCGACMEVCPVQDEQMLDIIDIRRNQVMVQGEFPQQLQTAFRGMERTSNPWGIGRDKRMEWAEGLKVPTIDENPSPDVIYWVGCAASYDPGAQKVSRAFVQLLDKAGVNYAVLGKKEACTGDAARRAGNEFLYQQLAQENVETLNQVQPKLIVATCPHCMNAIGNEYKQIGGDYHTIHHTEYLELLVAGGKLPLERLPDHVTYHDPCYLGRHNDVYDAPRNLISKMAGEVLDLEREREDSFCCGAGGAQFWKEEEEGNDRVSDNRFREIQARLDYAAQKVKTYEETGKVVAVGCPFCKSMLNSTPEKQQRDDIVVKDVAEIMLESMQRATGVYGITADPTTPPPPVRSTATNLPSPVQHATTTPITSTVSPSTQSKKPTKPTERKTWTNKDQTEPPAAQAKAESQTPTASPQRKKWGAKSKANETSTSQTPQDAKPTTATPTTERKVWKPKDKQDKTTKPSQEAAQLDLNLEPTQTEGTQQEPKAEDLAKQRKQWQPKAKAATTSKPADLSPLDLDLESAQAKNTQGPESKDQAPTTLDLDLETKTEITPTPATSNQRPKWSPKAKQTQESKPQSSVAPSSIKDQTTSTKTTSSSADSAQNTRPKWQPKLKQENKTSVVNPLSAEKSTTSSQSATSPETKEIKTQGAQTKTTQQKPAETGSSHRKKWQPKAQKVSEDPNKKTSESKSQAATPVTPSKTQTEKSAEKDTQPQTQPAKDQQSSHKVETDPAVTNKPSTTRQKWQPKQQNKRSTVEPSSTKAAKSEHTPTPASKPIESKPTTDIKPKAKATPSPESLQNKPELQASEHLLNNKDKTKTSTTQSEQVKAQPSSKAESNSQNIPPKIPPAQTQKDASAKPVSIPSEKNETKQTKSTTPTQSTKSNQHKPLAPKLKTAQEVSTAPNQEKPSSATERQPVEGKPVSKPLAHPTKQAKAEAKSQTPPIKDELPTHEVKTTPSTPSTEKKAQTRQKTQAKPTQPKPTESEKVESKPQSPTTKPRVFAAKKQPATPATRLVYSSQKAKIRKYETTPEKQKELAEAEAANKPVTKGRLHWNATSRKRKTKDGEYLTKFEEKRKKQKQKKRKKK